MTNSKRKPRRDIYQEVTDQIVKLLEEGTVPWRNPIKRGSGDGWPKNLKSGKQYRGINVFLLAVRAWGSGFTSDFWLTFKQAKEKGGTVRKGEKSSLVVFWKQIQKEDKETGKEITLPVLRHYNVFNAEQCDDIKIPNAAVDDCDPIPFEPLAVAENMLAGYERGPPVEFGGTRACYRPATDTVIMPAREKFVDRENFYATLFHELSHSTGHSSRLDRGLDTMLSPFGSPDYSREELVAEMSSAFLAAVAGISPPTIEQSAAYLDNWCRALKGDKRLVINAAGAAQKSSDWILGTSFDDAPPTHNAGEKLQTPVDQQTPTDSPPTTPTQLNLF